MTKPYALASLLAFALLTGCGPAGKITGKVTVEGGSAAKVLVRVLGPTSKAVHTGDSGDFTADMLADGEYQLIAEVPGTEVSEQRAYVKVTNGSADGSPTLAFKFSSGQLSGRVVFADMSDASGLTVALSGTDTRGALTDSTGAFSFTGLKPGAYLVSVEVPGSREGRQSLSVEVGGAAAGPLPDLVFTLLGTLTGNVKAGTTNAPGAVVNVPGTELFTLTDGNGDFVLRNVPTGMRTVQARLNAATSTQNVTVVKGDNTPLAFTLQTALTGTVQGSISFSGVTNTSITVSAAGTTWSTPVAANGDFTLNLPPGAWEIVADARNYPRNSLGVHWVAPGATTVLPHARMSLHRPLRFDLPISNISVTGRSVCEGDQFLVQLDHGGATQLHLVDSNLLNRRLIAAPLLGTFSQQLLSSKCKWAAFLAGTTSIVLHSPATGEQRLITATGGISALEFSTDESVLFYRAGTTLHRYTIATSVDDSFAANSFVQLSNDRYLAAPAGSPPNYQLITPTTQTTAFSSASVVGGFGGAAYALTDCTVVAPITCTLRTLGTSATTISTYSTGSVPNTTNFDSNNSTSEYFHFRTVGTTSLLVRSSNANGITMPASTQWIRYNPAGTRMAYAAPASNQQLREEPLPGTGSVAPVATSTTTFDASTASYVTDTRFLAFDNATPRKIDVKSGTAAIDTDVTPPASGTWEVSGSIATWGKASTSKRMALLGDGADQTLDSPANQFSTASSVAPYDLADAAMAYVVPKYGVVTTDANTTFLVDAVKNEVRKLPSFINGGGTAGNMFLLARIFTFEVGFFVPAYDQFLLVNEPGLGASIQAFPQPTKAMTWLLTDGAAPNDLLVVRVTPQP